MYETRMMRSLGAVVVLALVIGPLTAMADDAEGASSSDREGQWHLSVYTGRAAKDRLLDIITRYNTGFIDSYMVAAAPGFVHRETRRWRFEIEGQAVKHWATRITGNSTPPTSRAGSRLFGTGMSTPAWPPAPVCPMRWKCRRSSRAPIG